MGTISCKESCIGVNADIFHVSPKKIETKTFLLFSSPSQPSRGWWYASMTSAGAGIIAKANYVGRSYILGVVFIAKAQPLKWPFSVPISPVNDIKEPPQFQPHALVSGQLFCDNKLFCISILPKACTSCLFKPTFVPLIFYK